MRVLAVNVLLSMLFVAQANAIECTCRAKGVVAMLGESACISTPSGPQRAVCEKVLNNTTWRFIPGGCALEMTQQRRTLLAETGSAPVATPFAAPTEVAFGDAFVERLRLRAKARAR